MNKRIKIVTHLVLTQKVIRISYKYAIAKKMRWFRRIKCFWYSRDNSSPRCSLSILMVTIFNCCTMCHNGLIKIGRTYTRKQLNLRASLLEETALTFDMTNRNKCAFWNHLGMKSKRLGNNRPSSKCSTPTSKIKFWTINDACESKN